MAENKVASALGIDPSESRKVPELLMSVAFFEKLAERGIVPTSEEESSRLWQASEMLEASLQKQAELHRPPSKLDVTMGILQKTAGASQRTTAAIQNSIEAEASEKTAALINNPQLFAHGLALLSEMHNQ